MANMAYTKKEAEFQKALKDFQADKVEREIEVSKKKTALFNVESRLYIVINALA